MQPEPSSRALRVFLSHARDDIRKIRGLCGRLQNDGFDPWLAEDRLLPGQQWELEIQIALETCDFVLLCFSDRSIRKEGYIQYEFSQAMKYLELKPPGTIFVIPVRLDGYAIPHQLRDLQIVDYPEDYYRLVMALSSRTGKLPPNGSPRKRATSSQKKGQKIIARRYLLHEQVGQGRFGIVYRATDQRMNTNVAVKVMLYPPDRQQMKDNLEKRFEMEAKALSTLNHPNIIEVFDFGHYGKSLYLVMRYLSGGTLAQRLGKPMHYKRAAALLLPVAQALAYSHEKMIIHRDVKPSNILFTEQGDPVLSDFGLLKSIADTDSAPLTQDGFTVMGTLAYAAFEQLQGDATPQSDIYSLGLIFYELVTGLNPYHKIDEIITIVSRKVMDDFLPSPGRFVTDLPSSVEQVILNATAKNTGVRYLNMKSFATALDLIVHERLSVPQHLASEPKPMDKVGDPLLDGFDEDVKILIERKDYSTVLRLLASIEHLGEKGQKTVERLRREFGL
jgi:serine/threonine protein kinase